MDIVVLGEAEDHHHDDVEDDLDSDFISTEHVSLTKELQQQQSKAVEELNTILGEFELSDEEEGQSYDRTDLLSVIHHLHSTVISYKLRTTQSHNHHDQEDEEEEENVADMIDVDNITDEKLKLEVKY